LRDAQPSSPGGRVECGCQIEHILLRGCDDHEMGRSIEADPRHSVGLPRAGSATISPGMVDICWNRRHSPHLAASHDSRRWHWE
jgi:hypothetical protein